MKKLVVLALGLASSLSFADRHFGVNYGVVDYQAGFTDAYPHALIFSYGGSISESVEFQGRYGINSTLLRKNSDVIEVDKVFGAYFLFKAFPESSFTPYGLLGYTRGTLKTTGFFGGNSASESDFSFGAGFNYKFNESSAFNMEYTSYLEKDGVEISAYSFGYKHYF